MTARTLALPKGVKHEIVLPPYSHLPNLTKEQADIADLIVAALSTRWFPEAKEQHLRLVNKHIGIYRHEARVPHSNRAQRRKQRRKNK